MTALRVPHHTIYLVTLNTNRTGTGARSNMIRINNLLDRVTFPKYIVSYDMATKTMGGPAPPNTYHFTIEGGMQVGPRFKRFHGHYVVEVEHSIAVRIDAARLKEDAAKILGYNPNVNVKYAKNDAKQMKAYIERGMTPASGVKYAVSAPSSNLRKSI